MLTKTNAKVIFVMAVIVSLMLVTMDGLKDSEGLSPSYFGMKHADFVWEYNTTTKEVEFAAIASGISNYTWHFGDGKTGYGERVSHTYSESDNYTITLIMKSGGEEIIISKYLNMLDGETPNVDFCWEPETPTTRDTVQFWDNSTDPDDDIYNWTWDFGDGNVSYERNPVHRYSDSGRYDVTLFVKDISSGGNSATKQIFVFNVPPVADFYWTREGGSIKFLDYSYDSDGSVVNWTWDFGDGNVSYERNPVHNYSEAGIYDVTLTIKDDDSASNFTTRKINTLNNIPYVNFFWSPMEPTVLDTVKFNDNSSGIDDDIVNWTWDFGDGNISHEQNPSHQFSEKKTYTVTLTVIDERYALNTRSKEIEIVNAPPVVNFSWEPEYPADGEAINFTDESYDMDGSIVNWTWDFGDGNVSYERNASHAFSESGTYSVNLTVTDNDNASSSIVHEIMIANIYVDDDALPEWYDEKHVRTIQEAINNGSDGSHIYVMEGNYRENVVIDKLVFIEGNNAVLDGMGAGNAITVTADKVEIRNMEITNASTASGIRVEGNNVTVEDCTFTDSKVGIYVDGNDTMIAKASITDNIEGVVIDGSRNAIKESEIIHNSNGTEIIGGDDNSIEGIDFLDNFFGVEIKNGDGNILNKNYFEGNSFAIDVYTMDECTIKDSNLNGNGNGIRLFSDNSTLVENNTFTLNSIAILVNGDGNEITDCNIVHNQKGIEVDFSYNVIVNGCSFSDNDYGVYIYRSDYITVINSDFQSHDHGGVYALNCSRVGIFSSSFSYGGANIENSTGVEIRHCNYTNGDYGLATTDSQLIIENCSLSEINAGINPYNSDILVRNSLISGNGVGIKIHGQGKIENCFIQNNEYGIYASGWNGQGMNLSITGNKYGVYLYNSSYFSMENLSATGNDCGIYVENSSYNTISNSTLSSNDKGISMSNSFHNTIKNNTVGDSSTAMEMMNSRHNTVSGNEFKYSHLGLLISYSPLNKFAENEFNGNDYGIDMEGSEVAHFYEDMDASNKVNGMSVYYIVNSSGGAINSMAGYLALINCANFSLNVSTENNGEGILVVNSSDFSIAGSNFSDNMDGMLVISSKGIDMKSTKISCNANDGAIFRSSHDISITNCDIFSNGQRGINAYSIGKEEGNFEIIDSRIYLNWLGINIENVDSNVIENLTLYQNENSGIRLFESDSNSILHSSIYDQECGIKVINSESENISGNSIWGNAHGINISWSKGMELFNNEFNSSNTGVYSYHSEIYAKNCIFASSTTGINSYDSSLNATNCSFMNNTHGIYAVNSSLSAEKCNFMENDKGILIYNSDNAGITNCSAYNNTYGILINSSSYAEIFNCSIFENVRGIYIEDGSGNAIQMCTIYNNTDGIDIANSSSNILTESLIHHNLYGLNLNADENEIRNCSFWKNVYGAGIEKGNNNRIYHNNFAYNVENAFDNGINNSWDNGYPSGGNYWSDYSGTDEYKGSEQNISGSDGIGDIPYKISGSGIADRYPLMELYENASSIPNSPPSALFSYYPPSPFSGDKVYFMDRSTDPNGEGDIKSWHWDFGDGNTSSEQNPFHAYSHSGVYNISLFIEDASGENSSYNTTVEVLNLPPEANFSFSPENPATSDTIQFTDGSTDSDGSVVNWTWDFGDGTTSDEENPQHIYHESGIYAVTLTVTDDSGEKSTATVKITVSNALPTAEFFFIPEKASAGEKINFTDASTDDGEIVSWHWDFGDGTASDKQNPQHSYDEKGKYTVTLTVKDNEGGESTVTKTIEITSGGSTPGFELIALLAGIVISVMLLKRRDKKV